VGPSENLSDVAKALTIAGSDSGGGAGIQADLKTFMALGVHGMSAITALTAQNTKGVTAVQEMPPDFVREQIAQVATDIGVDAAKCGMLANRGIVRAVAAAVREFEIPRLVVDPVFVSKNKDRLLSQDAVDALRDELFPLATVITPNLDEASSLAGREVRGVEEMKEAAKALHATGAAHVLVKGGDLGEGPAVDVLYDGTSMVELSAERVVGKNTHGTGCALSAAIAAHLAMGVPVVDAVGKAKSFVTGAIRRGLAIGGGYGPVNPAWDTTMTG
jgi:hydroxymethylpyrimidine/phosphomethylpyrimidine kinase